MGAVFSRIRSLHRIKGKFDEKAVYKPYVMKNDTGWIMWYNGAMYIPDSEEIVREQIGVAYLKRENLWNE